MATRTTPAPPETDPTAECAADAPAPGRPSRLAVASAGEVMPALHLDPDRADPVDVLGAQDRTRLPDLVPLRYARMLDSPFTFFRGSAAIMAMDLAAQPTSGLQVQLCGDAHLANFGGFAAPNRTLIFDLNDFDETIPGPFEWDLKRLAASLVVAGRDRSFSEKKCRALVRRCARSYREAMLDFAAMTRMDVFYARLDATQVRSRLEAKLPPRALRTFDKRTARARRRTSSSAFARYVTSHEDGTVQMLSDPPVLVPLEELAGPDELARADDLVSTLMERYVSGLADDRQVLLRGYRLVGIAHKVVGVGSVGTRCWAALMAADEGGVEDHLVLQVKEASTSVLSPYLRTNTYRHQGKRVVAGQQLMQATGDVLLGWMHGVGLDGAERDFYVRQLWDWKFSADLATMAPPAMRVYAEICGWTLARAHARSGDRMAIATYLAAAPDLEEDLATFASRYADQNERDYERLTQAASDGLVTVADSTYR